FIIDQSMVDILSKKDNSIFIWCNADQFVNQFGLKGFYSGMFISEVGESVMCGFEGVTQSEVSASNFTFSTILSAHINKPLEEVYSNVRSEYGILCDTNPIVQYNHDRLYFS
ncbi:MAG: hypothetical protein ACK55Z_23245, partial [bacterium]